MKMVIFISTNFSDISILIKFPDIFICEQSDQPAPLLAGQFAHTAVFVYKLHIKLSSISFEKVIAGNKDQNTDFP